MKAHSNARICHEHLDLRICLRLATQYTDNEKRRNESQRLIDLLLKDIIEYDQRTSRTKDYVEFSILESALVGFVVVPHYFQHLLLANSFALDVASYFVLCAFPFYRLRIAMPTNLWPVLHVLWGLR